MSIWIREDGTITDDGDPTAFEYVEADQRDQLAEALQAVMEYGNSEHMDRRAAWAMDKARDALEAIGK